MRQNGFFVEVIKTNTINVDESSHALPPHNGRYSEYKVADYFCPEEWSNDGVFIPVKEGDPLWFDFRGNDECAILCAVQRINPVTGDPADLDEGLAKDPIQNYLRMPGQQWLDGYAKEGKVYQFVVTKAGIGLAVNEYVLPKHMQDSHAIGFAFFAPKNPKPKRNVHHHYGLYNSLYDGFIGISKSAAWQNPGEGMQTMGFSPESGNTCSSGGITHELDHASIDVDSSCDDETLAEIFCCDSIETKERGVSVDSSQSQNRGEASEVETVDILAQEANLNDLDKASMGAGGRIAQSIVTDDNTTDYYHEKRSALLTIYFALPEMHDAIMKRGKRQDASKKDKYKTSGHIGGVAVPLITQT